jgi:hypothetical protein
MKHFIDWTKVITTNREALRQAVAEIAALLALAITGTALEWPHQIQARVRRLLRPAESALRRLIIIMAKDVKVKLPPARPLPKGLVIRAKAGGLPRFRLYDSRKRFRPLDAQKPDDRRGPRIRFFTAPAPVIPRAFTQKSAANTVKGLRRRFAALQQALDTLPQQARRMARWQLRRALKPSVKFKSPLRPGQPPGHQRRPLLEVDHVLAACHGLAFDVLAANSS